MSRKAFLTFVLAVSASLAVACGNDGPPVQDVKDDVIPDVVTPDTLGDVDHDTNHPEDTNTDIQPDVEPDIQPDVEPDVDGDIPSDDAIDVIEDLPPDIKQDTTVHPFCPCDDTVNEPVCSIGNVTFSSPQCAACALCQDDAETCVGCTGEIDCQGNTELFIKRLTDCTVCPCNLADECAFQAQPIENCNLVCADDGTTEYADLCAFKTAMGCEASYEDHIGSFGPCPDPICALKDGTGDCSNDEAPVCGSDGHTYTNKCWLGNCPVDGVSGVTLACSGACPCM